MTTRRQFVKIAGATAAAAALARNVGLEKMLGAQVPAIPLDADITGAQAIDINRDTAFDLFPGLRPRRKRGEASRAVRP
jgi:hypothetical protein